MTMWRAEFWLTWLLRLNGALLSSALFTIFLPNATMADLHRRLGLGEMPDPPIVEYLARSCSALYAAHGIVLLFIAWRPRRFWSLIPLIGIIHLFLGLVLIATDLRAPMPLYWTIAEGPPIIGYAIVILWLWRRASLEGSAETGKGTERS